MSKHRMTRIILTAICSLLLTVESASAEAPKGYVVNMTDAPPYFDKALLEIRVGDTVTWRNKGPEMFHIVLDRELTLYSHDVKVGKEWSHTFDKPGVYDYICHRHFFMKGKVIVRDENGSAQRKYDFPYQAAFTEFVVPTMQSVPRMIVASKVDNSVWFTEGGGDFYGFEDIPSQNKVAQLWPDGRIVEYATPTPNGSSEKIGVDSLVMDKAGNVYFTERFANRIGVIDANENMVEYQIPTKGGYALGVDIDKRGNVWFAERYGNKIGYIDKTGRITEIELPEPESEPRTIFVGSDGKIWYTARVANEIGYFDTATKKFVRLEIPTKEARPAGIAETSDGTIYFVEMVGNKVAKVVGDKIVEYSIPTPFTAPFKVWPDHEDNLWFTQVYGNSISKFETKTGKITEYKIPTVDSRPGGITVDKKGRVWFTEQMGNKIGMFDPRLLEKSRKNAGDVAAVPMAAFEEKPPLGQAPKREDFKVPTAGAWPGNNLIEDEFGLLWFTEMLGNKIGSLNIKTRDFQEFEIPTPASMPVGLALAKNGVLWSSQFRGNGLVKVEPKSRHVTEYPLGRSALLPSGTAMDPEGNVWMTLMGGNSIVMFDVASEKYTEYKLPIEDVNPMQLAYDEGENSFWVTCAGEEASYLARFDLEEKKFEMFPTKNPKAQPVGLLVTRSGIWVAEGGAGALGYLEKPNRKWEEYPIPSKKTQPVKLAMDRDGRIWITDGGALGDTGGNQVAMFDQRTKEFSMFPMDTRGAKPMGIVAASDGNIWFTQQGANRISKFDLAGGRL